MNQKKGFTLIELLVVIGIIGVLATVIWMAISPLRRYRYARDAQRRDLLRQIANGLDAYYVNHLEYPHPCGMYYADPEGIPCNSAPAAWGNPPDNWIPGLVEEGYLKLVPKDPVNLLFTSVWSYNSSFFYVSESVQPYPTYGTVSGEYYILGTNFEYIEDPQTLQKIEERFGTRPHWPDCVNEIGFHSYAYLIRSWRCDNDPPNAF
ncbi:type II secretion system protein [candidate division WWE3 bacterium]|uniref:Type II secretion system protein n=1 Tax=candidate division WWE3 bacterium TaxID=2053526 RepID=A0A955LKM8_UNCKA|nr:type II secretion system protein [candidate division WWE3 bacterium]